MKKITVMGLVTAMSVASHAAVIASWDFESINGAAATDGQAMNGGYFDDASGNGNVLYAYSGAGYSAVANVFGNTSLSADKTTSWDGLHTDAANAGGGDLMLGGSAVGALAQWSISADVVFAASDIGNWRTVVGMDGIGGGGNNGGDTNAGNMYFQKTFDNHLRINFVDSADNRWVLDSTDLLDTADTWYNLQAVSDGSTVSLYINGVAQGSLDISGSADSSMIAFTAGTGNDGAYQWSVGRGMYGNSHGDKLDGYIDNVTITNIPEPATIGLVGIAGAGLLFARRRFMI